MAEPISIATALTWGMKAVGWVVSPTLSAVIKEAYSIFKIDPGDKLSLLNLKIVQLEVMLTRGEAEVLRHKKILDPLLENLKSAFYEVEEFLDLLDYNCLEKQALNLSNDKSNVANNLQKWLNKQASSFKSNDVPPGLSKKKLKKLLNKIECIVNAAHHTLLNLPQASLDNMPLPPSSHNLRSTGMPKSKVIGRDADVDNIVARLHEQEESAMSTSHYSVIGIHGIAGSGKTTLAQAIFAHEKKLACHFDKCIWIHVSQDFDLDSICRDLIQAVTGGPTHVSLSDFEQILDDQLDGKRYLLVLDDVWYQPRDANCSEQLLRILPPKTAGKRGSKVLVTSRSSEAALVLGALKHNCITISELDDNSFNELFMHYALGNSCLDEKDMGQYQECGARIATKLKKSPLLARAVGVQLYLRHNIDFWRRAESRNLLDDLMGALWWSYLHLPVPVRRCFAFCGIFPRRRLIYRDELIRMWIAAGFIRGTTEEDLESVANDYFDDLVSISFFQPGFLGSWQIRKFYVLHDLLHDLAVKVSGSDIFTIEFGWEGKIPPTVRHLFVKNRYLNMVEMVKPLKVLRTLVLDNANIDDSMLIALPKLRILSVPVRGLPRLPLIQPSRSTCMLRVPDSIAKLKHLRYVSFTGNFDSAEIHFPKNFAKLYHLEVLKFGCRSSVMFNFGKENVCYSNLRHLISSKGQLDVPYIGRARSLVTLDHFTVKNEKGFEIKQLHDLSNLRGRLWIAGLEHVRSAEEAVEAKLSCKIHLSNLVLEWKPREAVQAEIAIATEVLYSLCPPPDLGILKIIHYCGLPYPRWLVDRKTCLRGLRDLTFSNSSHPGPAPDLSSLISLEVLILEACKWNALPSSMYCLTKLEMLTISSCPNIEELPILPNSLQYINLWACNALFMKSCVELGHPNWEKVDHIPSKDIGPGPAVLLEKNKALIAPC